MSKKKLRKSHHRRSKPRIRKTRDTHHLCFIRRHWHLKWANAVRRFHYCTIEIPRDTLHNFIHENMSQIPVPSELAAKGAYEQLLSLEQAGALHDKDTIEQRLALLADLFEYTAPSTASGFRKQLSIVRRFYEKPP